MHAGADRVRQLREVGRQALDDRALERRDLLRPRPGLRVVPGAQLGREAQQPGPAVRPLEQLLVGLREEGDLAREAFGGEACRQRLARARGEGLVRVEPRQPDQHPVAVRGAVPVEAAVEDRVIGARRADRLGGSQHALRLVGPRPVDAGQRELRVARGVGGIERGRRGRGRRSSGRDGSRRGRNGRNRRGRSRRGRREERDDQQGAHGGIITERAPGGHRTVKPPISSSATSRNRLPDAWTTIGGISDPRCRKTAAVINPPSSGKSGNPSW